MESWDLSQLEDESEGFDRVVLATPDIDPFCSSTDWIIPATSAFAPDVRPWILRTESGYLTFGERQRARQTILHSLDPMWGFACPLLGADPRAIVSDLYRSLGHRGRWHMVAVSGVVDGSPLFEALIDTFGDTHKLFRGTDMSTHLASLDGGPDGYLARRSSRFRKGIRQATRRAEDSGIRFEVASACDARTADALLDRALEVEHRSWKAEQDGGIIDPRMQHFYRMIARRLAPDGRLRLLFARHDEHDIGYILGGVRDGVYRGLQVSFDQEWSRASIGNLLQWHQICSLADEGVTGYDLGMDMEYKSSWSDETFETMTVVIRP